MTTMQTPHWYRSLAPANIAVVGASNKTEKRGYQIVESLKIAQQMETFSGRILPIHPALDHILDVPVWPNLAMCPVVPDLAVLCTPANSVPQLIKECGELGIPMVVVLAAGFGESGIQGKVLEARALAQAEASSVRILGPNISGLFLNSGAIDLVGFPNILPGKTAVLSQSGNVALGLVCQSDQQQQFGFSHYFGIGNQLDLDFAELLTWLEQDEKTDSVVAYVEGFKRGSAFVQAARRFTLRKPLVAYKAGKSETSQQAAKSHTGSLAGNYRVSRDLLKQSGVTVVEDVNELLPIARTLAHQQVKVTGRTLIVTDGGGHGAIAADLANDFHLPLAQLEDYEKSVLERKFPGLMGSNPIDVAGIADQDPSVFAELMAFLLMCDSVDQVIWVGLFGGYHLRFNQSLRPQELSAVEKITQLISKHKKPVLLQSLYSPRESDVLRMWCNSGLTHFTNIETAVRAARALIDRSLYLTNHQTGVVTNVVAMPRNRTHHSSLMAEQSARQKLIQEGVSIDSGFLIEQKADLEKSDRQFFADGQRWAMKINSPDILHKSDIGAVVLNIDNLAFAEEAFDQIMTNCQQHNANAKLEGVLMLPMSQAGVEYVIGCQRDENFGPMIMFGIGGLFVELFEDVHFRALPIDPLAAQQLIQSIQAKKLLHGFRHLPPMDIEAMVDLLCRVGQFFIHNPQVKSIDLNPVIAHQHGVNAVDVRIEVYEQESNHELSEVS